MHVQDAESQPDPQEIPEEVLAAAKAVFDRSAPSSDLAILLFDSLIDGDRPADDHVLRFEHERFNFDLNVCVTQSECSIKGAASPALPGRFELERDGSGLRFTCDSTDGTFEFPRVAHGLVRLAFLPDGEATIRTDWFSV